LKSGAIGLLTLIALWGVTAAEPAAATIDEVQRVEAVGAFPINPKTTARTAPRNGAVRAAVHNAVQRIALALLPDGFAVPVAETEGEPSEGLDGPPDLPPDETGEPEDRGVELEAWLDQVLGDDPFEFATRFRILEDRGVRPALLSGDPDAENEYVVIVEVYVDTTRVRDRLQATGVLAAPAGDESRFYMEFVVEGLDSFAGYEALRRTLLEGPGVRSALPVEFQRGRVVLAVDADREASSVLGDLLAATPPNLRVIPLESLDDRVTLLVDWSEPAPAAEDGEGDAP